MSLGAGGLLAATGSIAGVISNPSATANMSAKEITADDLKITATADINAKTASAPNLNVNGDGGGLVGVAPLAAVVFYRGVSTFFKNIIRKIFALLAMIIIV